MIEITVCPWCDGIGRHFIVKYKKDPDAVGYKIPECPYCDGTGCVKGITVDHHHHQSV